MFAYPFSAFVFPQSLSITGLALNMDHMLFGAVPRLFIRTYCLLPNCSLIKLLFFDLKAFWWLMSWVNVIYNAEIGHGLTSPIWLKMFIILGAAQDKLSCICHKFRKQLILLFIELVNIKKNSVSFEVIEFGNTHIKEQLSLYGWELRTRQWELSLHEKRADNSKVEAFKNYQYINWSNKNCFDGSSSCWVQIGPIF